MLSCVYVFAPAHELLETLTDEAHCEWRRGWGVKNTLKKKRSIPYQNEEEDPLGLGHRWNKHPAHASSVNEPKEFWDSLTPSTSDIHVNVHVCV